jgi:iron only hydrogenase large subunit-like protein
MACPGGCIGGGGQPRSTDKQILPVRVCSCVCSFDSHAYAALHLVVVFCVLLVTHTRVPPAPLPPCYSSPHLLRPQKRQAAMYALDERSTIRRSHENPLIQELYKAFLGEPNSHKAHELLHTTYMPGGVPEEK